MTTKDTRDALTERIRNFRGEFIGDGINPGVTKTELLAALAAQPLAVPDGIKMLLAEAVRLLKRYVSEVPLGNQPHMIALEAQDFIERAQRAPETGSDKLDAEQAYEPLCAIGKRYGLSAHQVADIHNAVSVVRESIPSQSNGSISCAPI